MPAACGRNYRCDLCTLQELFFYFSILDIRLVNDMCHCPCAFITEHPRFLRLGRGCIGGLGTWFTGLFQMHHYGIRE